MPDLDVSDLLLDPDFAEELTIKRRVVAVGQNGRQTVTPTVVDPKPWGVVLPQNDAPMMRGPDQQTLPALLQVHTQFRLRGPALDGNTDYQPDIVVWNGADFVVNKVHPFSKYGSGFVVADCSSMNPTDPPTP